MTPEPTVVNPRYQDLQRLKTKIAQAAPEITAALDKPSSEFGGGKAWTGAAADAFTQEVTGRKKRLGQLASTLTSAIDAELRSTPEKCSPQEAASWRAIRRGNI
jgi:uncharacterized protein YukE